MPTTPQYEVMRSQVTEPLQLKVLNLLEANPKGVSRMELAMEIYQYPPRNLETSSEDRIIRSAIRKLRDLNFPIVSSSGERGYRLSENKDEIEAMAREYDSRAESCKAEAFRIRTIQKPLAKAIAEYRQTHKIVSQDRLL
jgi:hypothetical protein